jgi:hypothetical protein
MSLRVIWQYMDRSDTKNILYGSRHQMHMIWTSEASVQIIFFLVTDRSIYCHMTLSAMNYLLYIHIVIYQLYQMRMKFKKKIDVCLLVCLFVFLSIIFLTNRERNISACFF